MRRRPLNGDPHIKLVHITTVPMALAFLTGQVGYMKAHGVEVHALSSPGAPLREFGERERVPVHGVEMARRITPLRDLVAVLRLWWWLRRIRPHIVHSHTPKGGLLGMVGAWLARVPVRIYHSRSLPLATAKGYKRPLLRWSEKISCRLAHQVFCVSPSLRGAVLDEGLCPEGKISVLAAGSGNGVDACGRFNPAHFSAQDRQAARAHYGILADALVVGFVGRVVRDKGLAELGAAWIALRDAYPALHLLVVGPLEPHDPAAQDVGALLRGDPRIHLAGQVDDPSRLYAAMDLVVLPTYREGFPNVLLEAAAMELPVVATRVPGCVDAVQDGLTGTLVPARDAEALTEAVRAYLDDRARRREHGRAGRARVLRDFRQEVLWEAMYEEYVRLLRKKGAVRSRTSFQS